MEHNNDFNHGNQVVIHSNYGPDTRAEKYRERFYAVTNPHVLCMEDDIQNFVQLLLSWIPVLLMNW
jgi:hypothetical protein